MCTLQRMYPISLLILVSAFSDGVVFYVDWHLLVRTSPSIAPAQAVGETCFVYCVCVLGLLSVLFL